MNLADSSRYTRIGRCAASRAHRRRATARAALLGSLPDSVPHSRRFDRHAAAEANARASDHHDLERIASATTSSRRFRSPGFGSPARRGSSERTPGLRGIGAEVQGPGFVNAGVIGTQDRNLASGISYESPPGVVDEPDTKRSQFQTNRVQINERSLRLTAGNLDVYDRAEAYFRFPEGEKNFMAYKELRLWARGVRNGWGIDGDLQFFVKIGRDPNNFYLYRTPLNGGAGQKRVASGSKR